MSLLLCKFKHWCSLCFWWKLLINVVKNIIDTLEFLNYCFRFISTLAVLLVAVSLSSCLPFPGMIAWVCKSCPNPNMLYTAGKYQLESKLFPFVVQMQRWPLPVGVQLGSWGCNKAFQEMSQVQKSSPSLLMYLIPLKKLLRPVLIIICCRPWITGLKWRIWRLPTSWCRSRPAPATTSVRSL